VSIFIILSLLLISFRYSAVTCRHYFNHVVFLIRFLSFELAEMCLKRHRVNETAGQCKQV